MLGRYREQLHFRGTLMWHSTSYWVTVHSLGHSTLIGSHYTHWVTVDSLGHTTLIGSQYTHWVTVHSLGHSTLFGSHYTHWVTVHSLGHSTLIGSQYTHSHCCGEYKLHLYRREDYLDFGLNRKQNKEQVCCYEYFSAKIHTVTLIERTFRRRLMSSLSAPL
jgi:hypothetical protein